MAFDKNQYIGKRLTWDETVDIFPDSWVAFKDCRMSGIDMEDGILVDVIADKDIALYMKQHFNEDMYIDRTTENCVAGYIHGEIKEKAFQ
ncbi:MAG: hypothetical protein HDR25_03385 [Lachnospiraceae bacterium]|nr:hypothetical protein [Lachnospiraceae bacterium]